LTLAESGATSTVASWMLLSSSDLTAIAARSQLSCS
jgi:hypothetical protein